MVPSLHQANPVLDLDVFPAHVRIVWIAVTGHHLIALFAAALALAHDAKVATSRFVFYPFGIP